jgi:hypothetical protein
VKQKIVAGGTFDFATPGEVKEHIDQLVVSLKQEEARGIALWRDDRDATVSGGGSVTIPATGALTPIGANPGFAVLVQSARVFGLASGDIIAVYRSSVVGRNFVGQLTYAAPTTGFGSKGLILKGGENLIFTGASLTATDVTVNLEGIEVPETDLYKLVSP